jgi:GT2 family glycosyltransferase
LELSVVILNYNTAAFLELCLESVTRATPHIDAEIIVVDNASVDDSLKMVSKTYPEVKIIALDQNYGFSKANNIAVKQALGTYLCILNPDTVVGEEVFERCLAFAKAEYQPSTSNKNLGFVGVQLIDGSGTYLPESKRHIPTPKVARQKMMGNDQHYYYNEIAINGRGVVDVLVGAFMFCDKEVYERCGGFDERYFMYGEDIDLSYTSLQKGYENYYLGDLKVIHFKGESTVKDRKYLERFYGTMELFYDKYFKRSIAEQGLLKLAIKAMIILKPTHKSVPELTEFPEFLITETAEHRECLNNLPSLKLEGLEGKNRLKLIWDVKSYTLEAMISFMKKHGTAFQYRFLNHSQTQYIGSDRSQDRGEIKKIY